MQTIELSRARICAIAASLALSACGGGGGSSGGTLPAPAPSASAPVPGPTPAPPGPSNQTLTTSAGATNGQTGGFQPDFGDTASGGQGQTIDGAACEVSMPENYHVHAFVGVYDNGTLMALPAGIGMENPQAPQNGFVNAASCFYSLHTHDRSGIVHIEDANPSGAPITASLYNLKTALDIWGITADSNHFGPFTGSVRVFTSGQLSRANSGTVTADTYTYFGSDPNAIPLYSHEVIFIEVGPNYPASLPNVSFYIPE